MVRYHNSGTQKFDDTVHDSVKTEEAKVTNETFIRAERNSSSGKISPQTFINAVDSESKDLRNEFNSSAQFEPDKDGEYQITIGIAFRGSTSSGDELRVRIRNVTDGTNVSRIQDEASPSAAADTSFVFPVDLDSSKVYEIQATNQNSDFELGTATSVIIKRSLIQ